MADTSILDIKLFKRVMALTKPYKRLFVSSVSISILLSILSPIRPWLLQKAVDQGILDREPNVFVTFSVLMLVLLVVESVLRFTFNKLTALLGQNIIQYLRSIVFNHILNAKIQYFDNTPIGNSTTRTVTDIEAVNDTFSEGVITIFADLLLVVVTVSFMFWVNWQLTLCSVIMIPFLLIATRWFQNGVKKSYQEERTQISALNAFLQEHLTGMRIIQIFNAEHKEYEKFKKINASLRDANIRGIWYYSLFFPAVEIISTFAIGFMVWIASRQILNHQAEPGVIIAFILYTNNLFRPLRFIADKVNTIQRGVVAAERVFKLLDTDLSIKQHGNLSANELRGSIEFKNVDFSYIDNQPVIKNLSFQISSGKSLAIVGSTGSGKTSVINLIGRHYEFQGGDILIDNVSIRNYDIHSYRSRMAVVLQDVFLFAGSIFDNVTLRDKTISMEQVVNASKALGAHEFIMKLPGNYNYQVLERGATLSMGQRQLISFIRALVFNPQMLILDEATSSIDTESEILIQRAIETLIKGRTSIIIAHRLSTIRNVDFIMVMEKGTLMEMGTHNDLIAQNGKYKDMYEMQFEKAEYKNTTD